MSPALLSTKLYIPELRRSLVPRQRLIDRLDAGLRRKLTLISAPAGFGKTTLVSEWVRHCDRPVAWLSLDKNDNDISRFLTYLIAALQRIDGKIGIDVQAALKESQSPHYENLLTRLVSEIEAAQVESIMVLDDYHLIESRSAHDALNFLIEFLPPSMHLVITGRADPPLPISRLRVQREVNEVRTFDLRFTNAEVAAFLNDLMGFDLSSEDIAAMETRTEGWVASLQLAALSMHDRDDWHAFIAEFSGSNRYVIDYLVDEVMARQPEEVQVFLRRTSILDRLCATLCKAVICGEGMEEKAIIDYLDRSNLFLIPLDDRREWYRYHHLFADFLGQRLRTEEPECVPELHRRASQWFESKGLVDEAIRHALAAGDFDCAIRLVDQVAPDLLVRRESNKLLKLMQQLPPDRCRDYPVLCVWHAWALVFLGQLEAVEPILQNAETNQGKARGIPIDGYITTVRAYLANLEGDLLKSINLTEQALEEMSEASPDRITHIFQGSAIIWLGFNHRLLGNLEKARQLFIEAAEINRKAGNFYAALASFEQLAKLAVVRGQLHQALDIYRSALKMAQNWMSEAGKPNGSLIAVAGPQLGLGTVLYQLNDLAGAEAHIQRSADLFELGELLGRMNSYRMLAYLRQAMGEFEASVELYSKACAIEDANIVQQSNLSDPPSLIQLGILLSRAGPDLAHLLTEAYGRVENRGAHANDEVDFTSPTGYPREFDYSDLACSLIAKGRAAEALPLLARLLEAATTMERHGDEIYYLVLMALAQHALGDVQTALDSFGQALTLAEPGGYVRLFVDEGRPMAELLHIAISQNISPDYARYLLAAFPEHVLSSVPIAKEMTVNTQMLVDPLSEREIEVLRLIAEGCKYKEIAERLVVSINTVRHHTRNVYSKLDVNNRTQAIGKAKELNLL